jgi:hypothetical protein
MPDHMWAHAFFLKRGHHFKGSGYRAFDESVDSKACQGRTAHIEEHESIEWSFEARAKHANVYLHYVFDLWAQAWRRKRAHGDVIIVRFADDLVLGFQVKSDADQFRVELTERMRKFNLELHPEKTRAPVIPLTAVTSPG